VTANTDRMQSWKINTAALDGGAWRRVDGTCIQGDAGGRDDLSGDPSRGPGRGLVGRDRRP
jgi:hypothetical protein